MEAGDMGLEDREGVSADAPRALVMLSGWLLKKDPGPLLDGGRLYSTSSTCLNLGGGSPGSLGFKVTDFHPSIPQSKLQSADIFPLIYTSVGITCPTPTSVEHADIQVKNYSINSRERYVCNSGFKRKAGTSSLTQCVFNETAKVAHWTTPNLKCISKWLSQYCPSAPFAMATQRADGSMGS